MDRSFFHFPFDLRPAVCPSSVLDKSKVMSYEAAAALAESKTMF